MITIGRAEQLEGWLLLCKYSGWYNNLWKGYGSQLQISTSGFDGLSQANLNDLLQRKAAYAPKPTEKYVLLL